MKVDTDDLRRALDAAAARTRRASRGCPALDVVERLSRDEVSRAERTAFAEHLLVCPDCAVEYRLAKTLDEIESETSESRPVAPRMGTRITRRLAWAVAAALAVAIGLTATWLRSRGAEPVAPEERGAAESTAAVAPPDGSTLREAPAELTWTAVEAAEQYRVVLYDVESAPIWEATALRRPEAPLPDAVRIRLAGGGDFYWRVETRRRGERLSSRLYRFSVRRSASGEGR